MFYRILFALLCCLIMFVGYKLTNIDLIERIVVGYILIFLAGCGIAINLYTWLEQIVNNQDFEDIDQDEHDPY